MGRPCIWPAVFPFLLEALLSPVHGQVPGPVPLRVPGIENTIIISIVQDQLGALWLGTNRGLLRFDGASVERYQSDPADPRAIPNDGVYHVSLGTDGAIWAGTAHGVYRIDPVTGERAALRLKAGDAPARPLECLATAPGARGQWAFAGGQGIFFCTHGDTVFRQVVRGTNKSFRAADGWEAPDGTLWYCDRSSVRHFDPASGREQEFPCRTVIDGRPMYLLFTGLEPDRYDANTLWCTSWSAGFVRFDRTTGAFTHHLSRTTWNGLWNIVRTAIQLGPDRWMLSVDDSLKVFDGRTIRDPATPVNAHGLCRSGTGEVFIGRQGGLLVYPDERPHMRPPGGDLTASNLAVTGSVTDSGFWATRFYKDRALFHTDRSGRTLARIPFPQEQPVCEPLRLLASPYPAPAGTIWVGSSRGLWKHAPGTDHVDLIPLKVPGASTERPRVFDLVEAGDGRLWLNLSPGGVVRFDPAIGSVTPVTWPTSMQEHGIVSITRLDAEHVLAIPARGLPAIIEERTMSAVPMALGDAPLAELEDMMGAVVRPQGDVIFFASAGRLFHVRPSRPGGEHWDWVRSWQIPERPVFQEGACDGRGRLWLTSDGGAHLLDLETGLVHVLNAAHGVPKPLGGSAAALKDGSVVLAGNGAMVFGTGFEPRVDDVQLVLRRVLVNGADSTAPALRRGSLQLPHELNNITLAFGCIALLEGDVLEYAYRLVHDGDTTHWTSLGTQRTLNLTGLPPGIHEVLIRSDGPGSSPATMSVLMKIMPPWWATWWARGGFLALFIVLITLATRAVLKARYQQRLQAVEREREVERVRMRIARDIHDGIGSGLTKITMMTRQLRGDGEQARRIAAASTDLVSELGEIVWTVDPRNDTFGSFIAFVRSTLGKQSEHLDLRLTSELTCAPEYKDHLIGPEFKRNTLLVMKEAVNNALKHSGASHIDVRLELTPSELMLQVRDNGHGFDPASTRDGGNGLINFRRRAEAIGGMVDVRTGPEGTTIELRAPLPSTIM